MKIKFALVAAICLNLLFCASGRNKLARAREKDPQYQYNLGLFHLNGSNMDEALRYLNKSLALSPRFFLAWNAIGLVQSMKGNLEESAAAYRKCLEINAQFTEARNNLGTIYQELKFIEKAEEQFRMALQDANYSSRELPYYNLARLYFTMDRFDDALDSIRKSVQIKPRFAMAHNLMGLILEKKNDLDGAVDAYEQAVKIVPDETSFGYNLGMALFKNGEYEKAKERLDKIALQISDPEMRETIKQSLDIIKTKLTKE